jgi:hypothetical protein
MRAGGGGPDAGRSDEAESGGQIRAPAARPHPFTPFRESYRLFWIGGAVSEGDSSRVS